MKIHSQLQVGFGICDYTPAPQDKCEFRIYDRIYFTALIIRRGDTNVTFLAGDVFSIEEDTLAMAKAQLDGIDWLDLNHILPCASHIGTAPILHQSYVKQNCRALRFFGREEYFAEAMARAIKRAADRMRPARIGVGASSVPGVLYNRRSYDAKGNLVMSNFQFPYPRPELTYQEVDDRVYVIRLDRVNGTPFGCAYVFGCHALCSTDKYGNVSADYPGVARRVLRGAGIRGAFLPGSIGNVVPVSRGGRTYKRVGNSVAGAVIYALEQIETRDDPVLSVEQHTLRIPRYTHHDRLESKADPAQILDSNSGVARFYTYGRRRRAEAGENFNYTISVVNIAGSKFVHLPGEIFVETAASIKKAAEVGNGGVIAVISGPTADVGYLSTQQAHEEGGMEPLYPGLSEEAEVRVRDAACEMVR